jgi:hypothetical protein
MFKKTFSIFLALVCCFCLLSTAIAGEPPAFDPSVTGETDTSLDSLNLVRADVVKVVLGLINTALTFLGVISLILIIYAGFKWMLARGEEEEIKEAQEIIKGAVIGLIIVLASYGISRFIFDNLLDIMEGTAQTVAPTTP